MCLCCIMAYDIGDYKRTTVQGRMVGEEEVVTQLRLVRRKPRNLLQIQETNELQRYCCGFISDVHRFHAIKSWIRLFLGLRLIFKSMSPKNCHQNNKCPKESAYNHQVNVASSQEHLSGGNPRITGFDHPTIHAQYC